MSEPLLEIGEYLHISNKGFLHPRKLTPEEVIECYEYKQFKKQCPSLCELAECQRRATRQSKADLINELRGEDE
jgi:hypothetical protein